MIRTARSALIGFYRFNLHNEVVGKSHLRKRMVISRNDNKALTVGLILKIDALNFKKEKKS